MVVQSNLDSAVVLRSRSSIVLKLSSNRRDCKEIRTMPTSFDTSSMRCPGLFSSVLIHQAAPGIILVHVLLFSVPSWDRIHQGPGLLALAPQVLTAERCAVDVVDDSIL